MTEDKINEKTCHSHMILTLDINNPEHIKTYATSLEVSEKAAKEMLIIHKKDILNEMENIIFNILQKELENKVPNTELSMIKKMETENNKLKKELDEICIKSDILSLKKFVSTELLESNMLHTTWVKLKRLEKSIESIDTLFDSFIKLSQINK